MLADILYIIIDLIGEACMMDLDLAWTNASMNFNAGQYSIYNGNLAPALGEYMDFASEVWPETDGGEYLSWMYMSYDFSVLERAFSETIDAQAEQIDEKAAQAQELKAIADMLNIFG